ncbi:uncharacterized protein LOC103516661 [Diaphorina citri]|uniref:Uncharacterized protein LOC103516661 n=1 Tax=Diaphorina citri TaxID=121845 RepID=A0A3Q0JDJ9_DIACI|nr:uncharacterized protein LOC103516661 [Diaphorina citri]
MLEYFIVLFGIRYDKHWRHKHRDLDHLVSRTASISQAATRVFGGVGPKVSPQESRAVIQKDNAPPTNNTSNDEHNNVADHNIEGGGNVAAGNNITARKKFQMLTRHVILYCGHQRGMLVVQEILQLATLRILLPMTTRRDVCRKRDEISEQCCRYVSGPGNPPAGNPADSAAYEKFAREAAQRDNTYPLSPESDTSSRCNSPSDIDVINTPLDNNNSIVLNLTKQPNKMADTSSHSTADSKHPY